MKFSSLLCAIVLLLLTACGGGNSSSSSTAGVAISPSSASVVTAGTQQFTATVSSESNQNVSWQVNGVTGGSAANGTISGTGVYTAPASIESSFTVTVTAISVANSNKTGDVTVTVVLPISITPSTVSVQASSTQQFSASVNFSTNTGVTWKVNGSSGGNSTVGTIDANGLYTAPSSVPQTSTVTVTAVANADSSRTASANVTITPPAIVVSPTTVTLGAGAQQAFTATVLSAAAHPEWSVSCSSPAENACGTITSNGVYTAPVTPPRRQTATIVASMADGSATTTTTIATIQFSNATLNGTYVFTLADDVGHSVPAQIGTLVFDGAGKISGGVFDSTATPGIPVIVTGGTYSVGTDGRGTAAVTSASGTTNLKFALANNTQGFLIGTDSSANQSAGTLDLQSSDADSASLSGRYALSVSGITGATPVELEEAGSIFADGAGSIDSGIVDASANHVLSTATVTNGSYSLPGSTGRGTLMIGSANGTQTFAYYLIDSKHGKLVSVDGMNAIIGDLYLQPSGSFSAASFDSKYVFSVNGTKSNSHYGVVGVFTLDGAGSVRNIQFDGITQTVFDFNPGVYAVTDPETGRTTATWTGDGGAQLQFILYPRSDGGFVILQSDNSYCGSGEAVQQSSQTVTNLLQLRGAFAMGLGGNDSTSSAQRAIAALAVTTDQTLFGLSDGNIVGSAADLTLNYLSESSTPQEYSFGIAPSTLSSGTMFMYRINNDRAYIIVSDGEKVLTGSAERQY